MPKTTSVTFTDEIRDPDDALREVEIQATCHGRRSANMNYGGLPDPPEAAYAELDSIIWLDTDEDVSEETFEQHADYWHDRALEEASTQERNPGPEYDPVEHGRGRY